MTSTNKPFNSCVAAVTILSLIILATVVSPPSAKAAAGDPVTLGFNSLPSAQGWTYTDGGSGVPEASVFSVDGSRL
ncbi:MAG TPA: hypothetical protein VFQ23_26180, partial [Anaerolineales bacterium]|nr:hypothetical protein [Anaerolineales bacterium]